MWDPVAWFVGGGAEHSPEITRLVAFAATGGAEGIVGPADCKVAALNVPGAGFVVGTGAVVMLNRSPGGVQQSYMARMPVAQTVNSLTPTGGGGGRSDLVVVRVQDPQYAPWPAPVNPLVGPYVFTHVIENVPSGTASAEELDLEYPAIALARLDIPASTATLQNAHIVDLRKIAQPRSERLVEIGLPGATRDTGANGVWVDLVPFGSIVAIPSWATKAKVIITISGAQVRTADFLGELKALFLALSSQGVVVDENFDVDPHRCSYMVAGTFSIAEASRGTSVPIALQGKRTSGTGVLRTDSGSTAVLDITFQEVPV